MSLISNLIGGGEDDDSEQQESFESYHMDLIAPSGITEDRKSIKMGESYITVLFVREWPNFPGDDYIRELLNETNYETDISIHVSPRRTSETQKKLSREIVSKDISIQEENENRQLKRQKLEEKENLEYVEQILSSYDAKLYDVGFYVVVRGDTRKEAKNNRDEVENILRNKTKASTAVLVDQQLDGVQSVSPLGVDKIGWKRKMISGGLGAMYPFQNDLRIDRDGVIAGRHNQTSTPISYNRWDFKNGYNEIKVGKIGSGKSFSTKLTLLRSWAMEEDLNIYMMDPLEGFEEVYDKFGAERVTVGGDMRINPMRLEQVDLETFEEKDLDYDPFGANIDGIMQFFEGFFSINDLNYGNEKITLQRAVRESFKQRGITKDPKTHSKESPTVTELIEILEQMVEEPEKFVHTTDQYNEISDKEIENKEKERLVREKYGEDIDVEKKVKDMEEDKSSDRVSEMLSETTKNDAAKLLQMLSGFKEGGQYENFSKRTEDAMKIGDRDSAYLDLKPIEDKGAPPEEIGWYMKLVLKEIYNEIKSDTKNTILSLDEAHYMLKSQSSVNYLNTIVRHSRHFNIGLQFITQGTSEFFKTEEGRTIVDNCAIKWFQKVESIPDKSIEALGLSKNQYEFIKNAASGDENLGYSQALIKLDNDEYIPVRITPSSYEAEIVD